MTHDHVHRLSPDRPSAQDGDDEARADSIVDAIFAVTQMRDEPQAATPDMFDGALQAVLARRMRAMLARDRGRAKAA